MDSFINLIYLRFKVFLSSSIDFFRTAIHFYSIPAFKRADLSLIKAYLGVNPYRLSRKFLESRHAKEIYAYGETPIMTLQHIVKMCGLSDKDTIFELGCGRGRACFWLSLVLGADVVGIDYVPEFIAIAEKIRKEQDIKNVRFRLENFLKSNLNRATVLYLHGSCMEDEDIDCLNQKLIQLKPGLKVITVSFQMNEYDKGDRWQLMKTFPAVFSWGSTDVYFQILK